MVLKSSRYLATTFNNNPQLHSNDYSSSQEDEEFNEYDVVWSPSSPENTPNVKPADFSVTSLSTATTTARLSTTSLSTATTTAGLSAALTEPPRSPMSIKRKTTSSPVAMISSSLTRGDRPGLAGYCYYGRSFHQSAPVNVPLWSNGLGKRSGPKFGLGSFDERDGEALDDGETEMVPPHEIVARSRKTTSFSVIEGAGRTLKGRDLTTVRNAVFQKTGFL